MSALVKHQYWYRRKSEIPDDNLNTAKNVSTVDQRAIQSVTGGDADRNETIINAALFSSYSDALVKEVMEIFNGKTFMVKFCEDVSIQIQSFEHGDEGYFKRSIPSYKTTI